MKSANSSADVGMRGQLFSLGGLPFTQNSSLGLFVHLHDFLGRRWAGVCLQWCSSHSR